MAIGAPAAPQALEQNGQPYGCDELPLAPARYGTVAG